MAVPNYTVIYLAPGDLGFPLGDGTIDYGYECGLETYYRVQLGRWVHVSRDIWNPGYNRDHRGLATSIGIRINTRHCADSSCSGLANSFIDSLA